MAATIISLIGPPGSGKGTYGAMLAARFLNGAFLSVGDILRQNATQNTALNQILLSGTLADDAFVGDAVLQRMKTIVNDKTLSMMKSHEYHGKPVVVLDGFPRNHAQTLVLSNWPIEARPSLAIQFDVPDDICITKLLGRRKCSLCSGSFNINGVDTGGFVMPPILPAKDVCQTKCNWDVDWRKRDDDTAETIRKRMEVYHEKTEPVLNYWRDRDELIRFVPFNGVKDMGKLESLLLKRIGKNDS